MSTKILCPTDFSPGSDLALELAASLAGPLQAEIELLHVYQIPVLALPEAPITVSPEYVTMMTQKAQQELDLQRDALRARGCHASSRLVQGPAASAIVDRAKAMPAALVVMGTHGRSGFRHMLVGSVAERVVRLASTPVLTVRDSAQEPAGAARKPAAAIRNIVVAYDFSDAAGRALVHAGELASQLGARLHLVHVLVELYQSHDTPPVALPWPSTDQADRYARFLEEELHRVAHAALPELAESVQCRVLRGNDPVKLLEGAAEELHADLLCVASTGKGAVARTILGSVTQQLVRTSKVPVLTVH